jgi:hypothetical protein
MNLFENNGVHVLLQFVEWKPEDDNDCCDVSITMCDVLFSVPICASKWHHS